MKKAQHPGKSNPQLYSSTGVCSTTVLQLLPIKCFFLFWAWLWLTKVGRKRISQDFIISFDLFQVVLWSGQAWCEQNIGSSLQTWHIPPRLLQTICIRMEKILWSKAPLPTPNFGLELDKSKLPITTRSKIETILIMLPAQNWTIFVSIVIFCENQVCGSLIDLRLRHW